MNFIQNIKEAFSSIRTNVMRTIITCLIISFGIMALVGILTAIEGIETSLVKNFSFMGANSFTIQNRSSGFSFGKNKQRINYASISYQEAKDFKSRFDQEAFVSINSNNSWTATAKYRTNQTNPNSSMIGGDEAYMRVAGYELKNGRNLTKADVDRGLPVAVIGQEIKMSLFGNQTCLNKFIKVNGVKLKVIGLFESKGGAFDFGGDRIILIPVTLARVKFDRENMSYNIGLSLDDINSMDRMVDYSTIIFRQVRRLKIKEESNFSVIKSDSISESLLENLSLVLIGAIFIAVITLFGAAIALMNIMLVSVTERTKEIGTRKAVGAKRSTVLNQFIIEAITICQIGGIGGIILGLIMGNLISNYIGGEFLIPWKWISVAIGVCTLVGLGAGIWPARKASQINPIDGSFFS